MLSECQLSVTSEHVNGKITRLVCYSITAIATMGKTSGINIVLDVIVIA